MFSHYMSGELNLLQSGAMLTTEDEMASIICCLNSLPSVQSILSMQEAKKFAALFEKYDQICN